MRRHPKSEICGMHLLVCVSQWPEKPVRTLAAQNTKHKTEVVQDELLLYLQLIGCASELLFSIILRSQIVLTLDVALDDKHRPYEQNVLSLIEDVKKKKSKLAAKCQLFLLFLIQNKKQSHKLLKSKSDPY